jgi:hypothetical protein
MKLAPQAMVSTKVVAEAHAERGLQLLRDAHERAEAEDADEDDVVDENRAENDEKIAGHGARSVVNASALSAGNANYPAFVCASAIRAIAR